MPLVYKRILVKLSGEAFGSSGVNRAAVKKIVRELQALRKLGAQVAIVVGGGNLWRKRNEGKGMEEVVADYLGMLGTVMNALVLKEALDKAHVPCLAQSAIAADVPYLGRIDHMAARGALRRGEIVLFAGGTGKPYVTTDTAAVQRAAGIEADLIVKLGPIDGVYNADPRKVRRARKYRVVSTGEALRKSLRVMDREAFELALKHGIPIVVCKWGSGALARAARGSSAGTLVRP